MLRRTKQRYVSVMHASRARDAVDAIVKLCSELCGSIAAEKAAIRLVRSTDNIAVIKCALEQLDNVLVAIALTDPPIVTLSISGSMKRLRRWMAPGRLGKLLN